MLLRWLPCHVDLYQNPAVSLCPVSSSYEEQLPCAGMIMLHHVITDIGSICPAGIHL